MTRTTFVIALSAIALTASSLNADPWPHRRPGLWEMTMTMTNSHMPPMTSKYCIDQATEDSLMNMGQGMMQKSCPNHDVHVVGGHGTVDMVCTFGKYTQTSHSVIAFSGNTAYHSDTRAHMDPPMPYGGGDHTSTIDARWTGPCPADMKPGDIVTGNGMRMHMPMNAGSH